MKPLFLLASLWLSLHLPLTVAFGQSGEVLSLTDAKGRTLQAEVLSIADGKVKIRRVSGGEFDLPLNSLSPETQAELKGWLERKKAAMAKEKAALAEASPKPGETMDFEFPDLVKDFKGDPAKMRIRIPSSYDPSEPVGMLVWLPGGTGGNDPGGGGLSDGSLVTVGLPYPDDGRNPAQHNMVGDFDKVWDYWKPMLAKLEETVPNLDPKLRIIAGFSNGAHAIDGLLAETEFADFFTAFVLIDGGGSLGSRYRNGRDKHFWYAWGEKSPAKQHAREVEGRARRAGMIHECHEMAGVGHAFPGEEKEKVKAWIRETVIPAARGE